MQDILIQGSHSNLAPITVLSDEHIPSVRGEWYNYPSEFTPNRPLGYLMKCKANKDRPLYYVEHNQDVDIVFVFGSRGVQLCSPDSRPAIDLMVSTGIKVCRLRRTRIVNQSCVTPGQFDLIRSSKDSNALIPVCQTGISAACLTLIEGMIVSVMTPAGKYGLMRAVEVHSDMVRLVSCHILL
ncbi:MAG TPA: hypothetical protein VJI73_03550 [Candidatus Paceibacterota bacterium]